MAEKTASTGSAPAQLSVSPQTMPPLQPLSVKLTNAIDEALILRELLSPKSLRTCELEAWPDPSQTYLLLPPAVVRQLGLRLVDQRTVRLADGREASVSITEAVRIEWNGRQATEDALVLGERVALGEGLLRKLASPDWADLPLADSKLAELEFASRVSLDDDPWTESTAKGAASVAPLPNGTNAAGINNPG